jgi:hypothetical protein
MNMMGGAARTGAVRIAVITSLVAATGCTLLLPVDGLAGEEAGFDLVAGARPRDSGRADAASREPVNEAGSDAAVDPCALASFCDRFERDNVQGGWESSYTLGGATLRIQPPLSSNPTKSLALFVPSGPAPRAALVSPKFLDVNRARLEFKMNADAPARDLQLARMRFSAPVAGGEAGTVIDIYMRSDGISVVEQTVTPKGFSGFAEHRLSDGFKPNVWQNWTLEVDARTQQTEGIVTIDGAEVVRKVLRNATMRGNFNASIGAQDLGDGPTRSVFYDDVAIIVFD